MASQISSFDQWKRDDLHECGSYSLHYLISSSEKRGVLLDEPFGFEVSTYAFEKSQQPLSVCLFLGEIWTYVFERVVHYVSNGRDFP